MSFITWAELLQICRHDAQQANALIRAFFTACSWARPHARVSGDGLEPLDGAAGLELLEALASGNVDRGMRSAHHCGLPIAAPKAKAATGIPWRQTAAERLLNRMARGPLNGVPQECPHSSRTAAALKPLSQAKAA